MIIERSLEVGASVFADLAYMAAAAFCFMSVVCLGWAAWSALDKNMRAGAKLLAVSVATGFMSYQFHATYNKLMIAANGASSQPFYEMLLWIAVASIGLLPVVAIFCTPTRKIP